MQPAPPRRSRWWIPVVVGIVVLGVLTTGVVLWSRGMWPTAPTTPGTTPGANPLPTAPVQVEGGDLGKAVELRTSTGTATVTASRAEWMPSGELAPEPGTLYLVVDVVFAGVSGEVPVGPVMAVAETADGQRHPVSFGPTMPELVPGTLLHEGQTAKGSLGYMLSPGEVKILFLGSDGLTMGSVKIPGP